MKKIIITITFSIIMVTLTAAQIKKPTVKLKTPKVNTGVSVQGIKVNDLSRLKTFEDFEKLNIPISQITKEKLNAKPTQTWKISATHLYDGQLRFDYFEGSLADNEFWIKGKTGDHEDVDRLDRARLNGEIAPIYWYNFPLGIKFRVSADVSYILKLKVRKHNPNSNMGDIFIVKNETFISRVGVSEKQDYYIHEFTHDKSEELTLLFSSKITDGDYFEWGLLTFSEVQISRLPRE